MFNTFVQSIARDLAVTGAGYLVTHGFITADQEQGFVGAAFFMLMLAWNGRDRIKLLFQDPPAKPEVSK